MSGNHADEIEQVIKRLQERGEYEQLATPEAEREADQMGSLIARAEELNDEDVEFLLATAPEAATATADQLREEVRRTVARVRLDLLMQPPLERLRSDHGISVSELVDALIERLRLDRTKRRKVRRYYEELEAGLIDSSGVSRRVWEVIAERFHDSVENLVSLQSPAGRRVAVAFSGARRRTPRRAVRRSPVTSAAPGSKEWDEVDELFRAADAE